MAFSTKQTDTWKKSNGSGAKKSGRKFRKEDRGRKRKNGTLGLCVVPPQARLDSPQKSMRMKRGKH